MKTDEQFIALLEFLGWEKLHIYEDNAGPPMLCGIPPVSEEAVLSLTPEQYRLAKYSKCVPLLTLDLMHEAVHNLPPDQPASSNPSHYPTSVFQHELCVVLGVRLFDNGKFVGSPTVLHALLNATKEQRLEALLKTIRRWTDGESEEKK